MAKPNDDYVDMPGVAPITPASFAPNATQTQQPNPAPVGAPIQLDPVEVTGTLPGQKKGIITLDPVDITGIKGGAPDVIPNATQTSPSPGQPIQLPPQQIGPAAPSEGVFATSPLAPRQGIEADAKVFGDLADFYRKSGEAIGQGKFEEAQAHQNFAQQQEQSLGQSNQFWQQAVQDQQAREAAMTEAIRKGRALSVDPDNYWNRKGTGSNILSAIAIGLGSFASGMTHGATGNPALTLVNNAIDHDIQSQKDNIENYWKTIQAQKGLDDNAFNRAMVTQNMQANMRLAGMKVYESELKSIQARSDSQVVQLGAQKQIDDLQLAMNGERKQLAATLAAQQAAAAGAAMAQLNKDSESYRKETLDYMKEHPGLSPQEAARDVARIDPARSSRLAARNALPTAPMADHTADQFNAQIPKAIDALEKKLGRTLNDKERLNIIQGAAGQLGQAHPELVPYLTLGKDGKLISSTPTASGATPSTGGPDYRSKEQMQQDKAATVINPDTGSPVILRSAESATQYENKTLPLAQMNALINELKTIRAKHGGGFSETTNPTDAARVEQIKNLLTGLTAQAAGSGVLSDSEYKRNSGIIGNISSYGLGSRDIDAGLDGMIQGNKNQQRAIFNTYAGKDISAPAPGTTPEAIATPSGVVVGKPATQVPQAYQQYGARPVGGKSMD